MKTFALILNYLKAIASLIGAIASALATQYTDNPLLPVIAIIATVIVTWAVPNIKPEPEVEDVTEYSGEVSGNPVLGVYEDESQEIPEP